ncbi:DUF4097 family beta strand repeat-containing protein [Kitasatospora indigofera]|uniref:DUF4097 family beta strand repeat-containing protein n=1 Tax=Kitasatospora indigofera TaxID=67307 RepID=UPI0036850277
MERVAGGERAGAADGAGAWTDGPEGTSRPGGTARGLRVWRLVGGLVMAVVLVLSGSQAMGVLVRQHTVRDKTYALAARELVLDTTGAEVRIEPGLPGQVLVRSSLDWTLRKPLVAMLWEGDTLKVTVRCDRMLDLGGLGCGVGLDIRVPAATAVTGLSTSGSVEVRGLTGDVRLRSGSGAVVLTGLGGRVTARSGSGSVWGTALASARVEVGTGSGDARLAFARPPDTVTASTTSGELWITVPTGSRYRITGRSASGGRSIDPVLEDPAAPRGIDVSTRSGAVFIRSSDG